jgi:hypothetical protein
LHSIFSVRQLKSEPGAGLHPSTTEPRRIDFGSQGHTQGLHEV